MTRPLPEPFLVLATQNPIEYEGTFPLPEAQLDRFLLRLRIGYPRAGAERRIAARYAASAEPLEAVSTVLTADRIASLREGARVVRVAEELTDYLVAIVVATRERADIELGASPRASVALYRAAQAARVHRGPRLRPAGRHPGDRPGGPRPSPAGRPRQLAPWATADRILADIVSGVPVPVDPAYDRAG